LKRLLNTLYVTTPNAHLSRDGQTVLVKIESEVKLRLPLHNLGSIVCFGPVFCTPALMGFCCENQVAMTFLSVYGRFLARVQGPVSGNVLLRREQYRCADSGDFTAAFARNVVLAKLANSRAVLLRAARHRIGEEEAVMLRQSAEKLLLQIRNLEEGMPRAVVRGIEGDGARIYFEAFNGLISAQSASFCFHQRSRRPPLDNINALLSFVYTRLAHDVASALEGVGLDPAVGFR